MPTLYVRKLVGSVVVAGSLLVCVPGASAQQDATRDRAPSVTVFGLYSHEKPDIPVKDGDGGSFGVDLGPVPHFPVRVYLEGRATFTDGGVRYRSYVFGPKVEVKIKRFHPYGNFLIGYGTLNFNNLYGPGWPADDSVVKSVGGGLDIDIVGGLKAKGDWQYQFWDLGRSVTFTPSMVSGGLAYRFGRTSRH